MSGGSHDPYEPMRQKAAEEKDREAAAERLHLAALLDSPSGKWLLGDLLATFELELQRRCTGHNSEDSYHRGKQDAARKYRDLIIKHFGHAAMDRLMGGKQ